MFLLPLVFCYYQHLLVSKTPSHLSSSFTHSLITHSLAHASCISPMGLTSTYLRTHLNILLLLTHRYQHILVPKPSSHLNSHTHTLTRSINHSITQSLNHLLIFSSQATYPTLPYPTLPYPSSQATYAFKLFYPDGIDIFRADTEVM